MMALLTALVRQNQQINSDIVVMKIGLIRHFKVKQSFPNKFLVSYDELVKWFDDYESAEIEYPMFDKNDVNWIKCYASSSERATKTAKHIFSGDIIIVDELRELSVLPLMNNKLRLPVLLWGILIRRKSVSRNSLTEQFKNKITFFIDELLKGSEKEVLIVSHGLVMIYLQRELIARGFMGAQFRDPVNGKVYVYERA